MENQPLVCTTAQFEQLLDRLKGAGYTLLGPTLGDESIVYGELQSAQNLPIGWTDEQGPGTYRLKRRNDMSYFGYSCGQDSWKKYFFPAKERVWSANKQDGRLEIVQEPLSDKKRAFIGIRACDVQSLFVLDRVYQNRVATSQRYQRLRENTFIVAVNCTTCSKTCFCNSM